MQNSFKIIVSGLVVNKDGEFLLAQRSELEEVFPGYWAIPGGKVEINGNESPHDVLESNLQRELKEELGIDVGCFRYLNSHFNYNQDQYKIYICFLGECISDAIPQPLEDTIDVRYFSIEKIKDLQLAPNVGELVEIANRHLYTT
ncbi:NUDIX hydrolase [Candidatus Gracilibacteria bacterium]|nr:NUDIX hydrolase [Candidatus Gracilibacteria bacterium]